MQECGGGGNNQSKNKNLQQKRNQAEHRESHPEYQPRRTLKNTVLVGSVLADQTAKKEIAER